MIWEPEASSGDGEALEIQHRGHSEVDTNSCRLTGLPIRRGGGVVEHLQLPSIRVFGRLRLLTQVHNRLGTLNTRHISHLDAQKVGKVVGVLLVGHGGGGGAEYHSASHDLVERRNVSKIANF